MLNKTEIDLGCWTAWKKNPADSAKKKELFNRFAPTINAQVNKWRGPVPAEVLRNKAKVLAYKAFQTYDPEKGASLNTHVVTNLAPISRTVYKLQNTARLPENISLKVGAFKNAQARLTLVNGQPPTNQQMHDELGWPVSEISRIANQMSKDLVESVGGLNDTFYDGSDDADADMLAAVYADLLPEEQRLFESVTGYGGAKKLNNTDLCKKFGLSQAQLSYKKTKLKTKVSGLVT